MDIEERKKTDKTKGMLHPTRDKNEMHVPEGRREGTRDHDLSRRSLSEGKTSYEFSWKVKAMIVVK